MSILKIAKMGHPILKQIAEPIHEVSADIQKLAQDMIETMMDANGTGLAATQIHEAKSMLVYFMQHKEEGEVPLTVLLNPILAPVSSSRGVEISYDFEACLSVPHLTGIVPRYHKIHLKAFNLLENKDIDMEVSGYHARILQHEIDHLYGYLYPMRMEDVGSLYYQENLRHISAIDQEKLEKSVHIPDKPLNHCWKNIY